MKARELMTAFPAVVTPTDDLTKAAELMRDRQVGMLPVVDDPRSMRLEGVITDRDMAIRCIAQHHSGPCPVSGHMTRGPIATVEADDDATIVLERMDRARVRRLPVVDEASRVVGVIAQADVVRKLYGQQPSGVADMLSHVSEPTPALVMA